MYNKQRSPTNIDCLSVRVLRLAQEYFAYNVTLPLPVKVSKV